VALSTPNSYLTPLMRAVSTVAGMSRTSATRDAVLQLATERLNALVGARDAPQASQQQPIVIEAPAHALRPIIRIAVAVCVFVAFVVWLNRPQAITPIEVRATGVAVADSGTGSSGSAIAGPSAASTQPASTIVVDVEGHVRHPGLVTLPVESRVADAIAAAGGLTKRIAPGTLNLAQKVADGQLIVVTSGAVQTGSQVTGTGTSGSAGALININSANASDLDALPGVGPVMSSRIISWRTENGGFKSVDDLQQVPGIGPKVFANLKPLVCT